MCIRDRRRVGFTAERAAVTGKKEATRRRREPGGLTHIEEAVSYTHLRAHETVLDLVCRLLLEKKKKQKTTSI